jgi:rhodanese-related sulfurtransferase
MGAAPANATKSRSAAESFGTEQGSSKVMISLMMEELSPTELLGFWAAGRRPAIIDVRTPTEFATGHLAGALNLPLPELEARRGDLRGEELVLVCERGMRARAARAMLLACFPEARVLSGGMHAWRKAKLPMVQVTRSRWSLERQVRLIAGSLVLAGIGLSLALGRGWLALAALPGAGLVLAGLTDLCPMGLLLLRMPWNQVCRVEQPSQTGKEATT